MSKKLKAEKALNRSTIDGVEEVAEELNEDGIEELEYESDRSLPDGEENLEVEGEDALTVATTALDSTCENGTSPLDEAAKQQAYEREYQTLMEQFDEEKRH